MVMEQPVSGPPSISGGPAPVDVMRPQPQSNPSPIISARSIGMEFVRQYYTLLNNAPLHLHRFYSNQSSFVHSGHGDEKEAEPVYGQQAIHQKIMQLNFRECHAKIKHVDAHPTHGSGVVVQVCGELSNDNQGLRKFMQTFVLATQGPNKYYLHNDIFRYQDEFWPVEGGNGGSADEKSETRVISSDNEVKNGHKVHGNNNSLAAAAANVPSTIISKNEPPVMINGSNSAENVNVVQQVNNGDATAISEITTASSKSGPPSVSIKETEEAKAPVPQASATLSSPESPPKNDDGNAGEEKGDSVITTNSKEAAVSNNDVDPRDVPEDSKVETTASNVPETITYATLVKAGQTTTNKNVNVVAASKPAVNVSKEVVGLVGNKEGNSAPANTTGSITMTTNANTSSFGAQRGGYGGRGGAPMGGRGGMTASTTGGRGRERFGPNANMNNGVQNHVGGKGAPDQYDNSEDRRRNANTNSNSLGNSLYPDSHQLFVGNLPHNCTESQLESLFSKFGTVADIRINNKGQQQSKTTLSGARVPNFGFVIFEEEKGAQTCLKSLPLFLPENNHRLNVEEKKNKARFENNLGSKMGFQDQQQQNYGRNAMGRGGSDRGRGGPSVRGMGGGNRGMMNNNGQQQQAYRRKSPFNNGPNIN